MSISLLPCIFKPPGKWKWSHSVVSNSLGHHGPQSTRPLHPWDFPGKNTGVGCHFLLQGIFPTQGLNPGLRHCRLMLYRLNHQGNPTDCPQFSTSHLLLFEIQSGFLFMTAFIEATYKPHVAKPKGHTSVLIWLDLSATFGNWLNWLIPLLWKISLSFHDITLFWFFLPHRFI